MLSSPTSNSKSEINSNNRATNLQARTNIYYTRRKIWFSLHEMIARIAPWTGGWWTAIVTVIGCFFLLLSSVWSRVSQAVVLYVSFSLVLSCFLIALHALSKCTYEMALHAHAFDVHVKCVFSLYELKCSSSRVLVNVCAVTLCDDVSPRLFNDEYISN